MAGAQPLYGPIAPDAYLDPFIASLDPFLQNQLQSHLWPHQRMTVGCFVGKGNFGEVSSGTFVMDVAIKTCIENDPKTKEDFLREAVAMKNFDHPNVIKLIAIVIRDSKPYMVLPLMKNGDLKTFVHKNVLTIRHLITFARDVAKGMDYLATTHNVVHRDLAARNCLVDGDLQVKVADFGLARDMLGNVYYRVQNPYLQLPPAWMALETLQGHPFTFASDVWSFGVLFWEVMTGGSQPYNSLQGPDVLAALLAALLKGDRLPKPQEIYNLMRNCWQPVPANRPTFPQLVHNLNILLLDSTIF